MKAHALRRSIITVHECRIRLPFPISLEPKLLPTRVHVTDASLDFLVDSALDLGRDFTHARRDLSYVRAVRAAVGVLCRLLMELLRRGDVDAGGVGALHCAVEELELGA